MPDTTPARVVPDGDLMVHFPALGIGQDFIVVTSFPTDTVERRSKILDIIEGEATKVDVVLGITFLLTDFVCHPIQLESQDGGEIVDAVRTLLVTDQGEVIGCVSQGILKSLQRLSWAIGRQPPWVPPVKVKLVQRSTGKGRRIYKLVPVTG